MFFPVGCNVKHNVHGGGGQVEKPSASSSDLVHVKFESGTEMNSLMNEAGLVIMKY